MALVWLSDPAKSFEEATEQYTRVLFAAGRREAVSIAEEMEAYAKEHRPWQDQTGDARDSLTATVEETGPIGTIELFYDTTVGRVAEYAIWLEIANQGRFSILAPTTSLYGPKLAKALQRLANLRIITLE